MPWEHRVEQLERELAHVRRAVYGANGSDGLITTVRKHDVSLYGDSRSGMIGLIPELRAMRKWFQTGVLVNIVLIVVVLVSNPNVMELVKLIVEAVP